MNKLSIVVGTNIKILRKSLGISQEELAYLAGLHRTYIGQIERGEKNITLSTLHTLTQTLGISLGEFFLLIEPKVSPHIENGNSSELESNRAPYLPFLDFVEILQDANTIDQKKILEALKFMVEWANNK